MSKKQPLSTKAPLAAIKLVKEYLTRKKEEKKHLREQVCRAAVQVHLLAKRTEGARGLYENAVLAILTSGDEHKTNAESIADGGTCGKRRRVKRIF